MDPAAGGLVAHFRSMARNNAWANARLLGACAALDPAAFAAPRPGFFPSLKATLNHILAVDRYYLDALEAGGRGRSVHDAPENAEPAALARAQAAQDARLAAFCGGLDAAALAREVATDRGARGVWMERTDALLAHLFQHQIHHRGQAHAMLSHAGVAPPQLDDFFLVFDRDPALGPGEGPVSTGG